MQPLLSYSAEGEDRENLPEKSSRFNTRRAGFSGFVMSDETQQDPTGTRIPGALPDFFKSDVRATNAMLGRQKPVSLY